MKKQHVLILSMILMIAIVSVSASALQISSATIGDAKEDRVSNVTAKITVTNNGNTTLNNIALSTNAFSNYNIRFSPATITTLAVGAAVQVTVTGDIPLDFDAVETDESASDYLKEKAINIGTITATAGSTVATSNLNMQAKNQLEFKKVTIECGDTSKSVKDDSKIENLKPDTACSVFIEVENNFNDKDSDDDLTGDIEFEDADVALEVDDDDFDVDEEDSVDPAPEDTDDTTLDFDIDEEVNDGSYDLVITVLGQDENDAWHGEKWEVSLNVDRLKHDLQIKNAVMNPEKMDCEGGQVKVDAKIINLGKRDEDDVTVELEIPDLDLITKRTGLELNEDDYTTLSFTLKVPEDVKEGVYAVNLKTYFDGIAPSNTKSFNLAIEACEVDTTPATTVVTPTTPATTTPTTTTGDGAPAATVKPSTRDSSFWDSNNYLYVLGALIAAVLIVLVVLIVIVVRKPKN
ncbi:hypothetical protein KY333_01440 [Candidatus Woesearchaeota archaeon]|nr:hypothetical protein [Candidatus Woesearchaeota archaeon]